MKIKYCDKTDSDLWDTFVYENLQGSFFHLYGWKHIYEKCFDHETFYLAAVNDTSITGVFPMVYIRSRFFGKILCSMPFMALGGPCSANNEIESLLLQEAYTLVNRLKVDYLEIRGSRVIDNALSTSEHKTSLTLELDPNPDVIWNSLKTKQRTCIRRSYKNGLWVKVGNIDMLDTFYEILSENWRDLGTPIYKKKYFENILTQFPDMIKIFVIYYKDTPIGTALNGYYKQIVEGMWAGTCAAYRRLNPNYVLYWEMIKDACESKFKTYHLGRSSVKSGGEFFKKKWNAQQKQLYWQYFTRGSDQIPQLNISNPKYDVAIRTWRRLPLKITNYIGPYLAKNLP